MFSSKLVAPIIAFALCSSSAMSQGLQLPTQLTFLPASTGLNLPATPSAIPASSFAALNLDQPSISLTPEKKSKTKSHSDKLAVRPFSTLSLGIKASTLGAGAELATPLARSLNLRAGANFAQFRYSFRIDGINYFTAVNYASGQMTVDWFPFHGGFHISPGALYFKNGLAGAAVVPPGQPFQLDNVSYINSVDDPVGGNASIVYHHHIAPLLLMGFSNLIPRDGSHFSVPFEFGVAYSGAPVMAVALSGTACTMQGCFNAGTDPATQQNLKDEVRDVDNKVKEVIVYPIVSLGIAVRF